MKISKAIILVCISLSVISLSYLTYNSLNNQDVVKISSAEEPAVIQAKSSLKDSIVNFSMELLGTPYLEAGSGKEGFDCSGFVYYVFGNFNIDVPRSTAQYESFGEEIPFEEVEKGDLLLFLSPTRNTIGHIGIVSETRGAEIEFIHSTSGSQMQVVTTPMTNPGYKQRFVKAIRVL